MNHRHLLVGASLALGAFTASGIAAASSHREAPLIALDPAADNTDLWAWVNAGAHDKLYVVASYNPLEEPSGGPNFHKFDDNVLYEIHIARGDTSLDDAITYQIKFKTTPIKRTDPKTFPNEPVGGGHEFFAQIGGLFAQTYTVTKVVGNTATDIATGVSVAPPNIGPRTNTVAYQIPVGTTYAQYVLGPTFLKDMGAEGKVWAGPRDDGFYVDLARIFDLANVGAGTATDGVSGYNSHTIALEIPTTKLTANGAAPVAGAGGTPATNDPQTLGIWASASRRKVRVIRKDGTEEHYGPWTQVSRLGIPLINEAVIGIQDKDKYNRTRPRDDVANFGAYFLNPVIVLDALAVGILNQAQADAAKTGRTDILNIINLTDIPTVGSHAIAIAPGKTGDVLRVDMGFDPGFPNGRPIASASLRREGADVTDIELSLLLVKALSGVSDGVNSNDADFLTGTPWLAAPWEGFSQGHGKTPNPN